MDEKEYRLVGILNCFDVVPASIYPVFMDDDNFLYRAFVDSEEKEDNYLYTQFVRVPDDQVDEVRYLSNCMVKLDVEQETFKVGDLALAGIELNNGIVYIGTLDKYLDFINEYKEEIISGYEFREELLSELQNETESIGPLVRKAKENGVISEDTIADLKKVRKQD